MKLEFKQTNTIDGAKVEGKSDAYGIISKI